MKKAAPKKKAIPPELEERQKQALARMEELGVPPRKVSTHLPLSTYYIYNV